MALVSLELFKQHVRADDFSDDDSYLQHCIDSATAQVLNMTNRTEAELTEMGGGEFPVSLVHAILLLGGHYYNQRESDSNLQFHSVPNGLEALVKPFRKLANDVGGENA